ncbi:T9SS type A sorting domain-containing protein [Olleya sp. ITB9]|uniref:T9SS type A sorting domain-containing protein n=1 Tax=Olleya sp. ITB9 TaxID=1715648 RepID=UPI0006D04870|nr:T9SS type A sorting domain-containing protein [Olleya sp. ITB9]
MKKLYFFTFLLSLTLHFANAQGSESFTNHDLSGSSYADGSFVGDNGVTWNYVQSRDENGDSNSSGIDGKAIMLRRQSSSSSISAQSGANGVGAVTMKLYKGFTGSGGRQVELFVNGISQGVSESFDDFTEHIFTVDNINISGDVTIEVVNITSKQVIVDDVTWTEAGETLSTDTFKTTEFSIFPNPSTAGFVNIKTSNNQPIAVAAYDVLGKQVINTTVTANRLDVSSLTSGVYILKLTQEGATTTKKLVIK